MFCPKCGIKNADGAVFCMNCGNSLQVINNSNPQNSQVTPSQTPYVPPQDQYIGYSPQAPHKSKKGLIVGFIIGGAALIATVIVVIPQLNGVVPSQTTNASAYNASIIPNENTERKSSDWVIETVDSTGDVGEFPSLAVDESGHPHIAYHDLTNGMIKYAYYNGTDWSIQSVAKPTYDRYGADAGNNSIALDGSGRPYICYATAEELYFYTFWDGSSWSPPVHIPSYLPSAPSVAILGQNSIAVDKLTNKVYISISDCVTVPGHPYIGDVLSYWDSSQSDFTMVDYSEQKEEADFMYRTGTRNTIALDSKGNPHIVYDQEFYSVLNPPDNRDWVIKIADWDGKQWVKSTIAPFVGVDSSEHRFQISLKYDSKNYPHIAYYNGVAGGYQYAYWNGSSWVISTICEYGSVGWESISMDLDSNDNPHIAALAGGYQLLYATLDGDKWTTEIVDSGSISECELAVGKDGAVNIAYYNSTNFDLKYARLNP